ncbi:MULTISPECIES: hypothetical protein [Aerosakkonema]|uniref:hypothetical protein n=1 Tax=Aerosakkonema TaxID=1246629 RepID=UPI0035BA52DC
MAIQKDSIAQTLQAMGFSITFPQPEYPDHPASATILGAVTNTGKGISVSVPIAGQVFDDVDGTMWRETPIRSLAP